MKGWFILFGIWLTLVIAARCQGLPAAEPQEEEISTARPDNTDSPTVVPLRRVQLETGILLRRDQDGGVRQTELFYPRFLVRIGVLRNVELRLEGDHRREERKVLNAPGAPEREQGLNAFTVGTKVRLVEGEGLRPGVGVVVNVALPYGGTAWVPLKLAPQVVLAFSHDLTESLQVQYNLGWERDWEGGEVKGQALYTLALQQDLSDYIKVFGEVFGTKAAGEPMEHTLDGGLLILLRRNLQLDIWGGVGLSSPASDYFIGTGLAIRLPR